MVRQRVRIRFCKQGDLRLIGHRDLMRCMERLFRRAALPLAMSRGFHPKPRMTFPSALAVGIEGIDEVMELELEASGTAEQLVGRLRPHAPPGLALSSIQVLPPGGRKARLRSVSYQVPIPSQYRAGVSEKIDRLLGGSSCPIQRPRRSEPIDLRPLLAELKLRQGVLQMRLWTGSGHWTWRSWSFREST
jgi:radical SAM-linked protein